jgi:hypothetical protein
MTPSTAMHFPAVVLAFASLAVAQPLQDTTVSPLPDSHARADTTGNAAVLDTSTVQSASGSYSSAPEPSAPDVTADERPFSLFDYRQVVSIGLSLGYLYYSEDMDLSDEIQAFTSKFGRAPRIVGTPKSTEYGALYGLSASATFYSWENRLIVRPRAGLLLGLNNTYDGSTQAQWYVDGSTGDTAGFEFDPLTFQKNNAFLFAGCDIGYAIPYVKFPFFIYTGLDFKLWYRDLVDNGGELLYTTEVSNSETYYWLSAPLGVLVTRPVSPRYVLGTDACVNFMFFGGMQAGQGSGGTSVNYPPVTLGNRESVKVELFVEKKRDNKPALRFAPYFLYYTFGKSTAGTASDGTGFFEPSSNSFLFGFTVSWEYLGKRIN